MTHNATISIVAKWLDFAVVLGQQNYYSAISGAQPGNSLLIAASVGALTLLVATAAAFAISRLRVKDGTVVRPWRSASGNFLAADDSPWELLMANGPDYALPPAAISTPSALYGLGFDRRRHQELAPASASPHWP